MFMSYSKQKYLKDNEDNIKRFIDEKRPITEIARFLNVKYDTLKRYLINNNIPFETNQHRKGFPHKEQRKPAEYYLKNNVYISAHTLRKKLVEDGLKENKCECCGNNEWMGKPIPLELHHLNGNHYDNKIENLQILCRNCHGQIHEYGKKK